MATKGVCGATMSFAKVEQYLSGGGGWTSRDGNGTAQDMTIGKVSLLDLKATMQANDVEMEKLRRHVKKEREKEKADELRGLKLKQQKALLKKKQVGMNLLEDERKRELAELVKQKEILTQKEQAALHEIQALEKRVKDQELQHRDDERKVLATIQRMDDGSKGDARVRALRATHMQRSQTYGAQAALLGHKRMELQQLQEKLKNDMTNLDVRHTRKAYTAFETIREKNFGGDAIGGDNQADDANAAAGVISFNYDEEKHRVKNFDGQFGGDIKGHETSSPATDSSCSKQPHSSSVRDVGKSNSKSTSDDSPSPNNWNDEPKPTPRPVHSSDQPTKEEERGNTKPLKDNAKTPTAPAPLDALEREVLHRNESDHTLKQSRPSTPRIAKAPQAPPMNHPPLHGGNLPSSSYPPSMNPEVPPYAVPPMASHMWPPPNYTSYGGAYPYFAPPPMSNYGMLQPPYYNGYTGFAATGAAIMGGGYPPPMMNPYGMQPTPYMQHQPMSMMPNMMMNPGMFEPPPDPETVKLQQQLEAMKQLKEQRELEMETLRFQQMIQSIQGKLPGAANGLFTNASTGQQQSMSAQSSSSDLAPKMALAVADELESKELKALKLKHAEDMLKLKQQRDLMEEEERLQDMKEQREKRRREMDEQMAQEEWMANQKRMVMALRMKKVLAQEQPLAPSMTDDMAAPGDVRPYDPELGFSVFWDYILLVPAKASFLQMSGDHGTAQYTALLSALRPSDPKEWTHSSSDCVQLVLSLPSSSVPLYSSDDRPIDPSTGLVTAGPWKVPLFSVPKPLSHNQPIVITLSHKRSGGVVELYSATLALEDAGGHDVVWDEQLCDLYSNPRNIPPQTLFGRGDGLNVYVDGLRSLPDPVTISKVTCFALNADMTSVSPLQEPSAYTTLQDNASSPSFKLCLEYRGDRFNPTLTLLCRVDTIHGVSKQPMVVGYAALPLFVEHRDNGGAARTAPTKATVQEFCLNTGAFQLPLRLGATLGTNEIDFSATACDGYMKLPCATILVRVCPAAKTEDGLACLSRNDVATSDWIARGVSTPAPNYADKAYDSTASRPSLAEDKLYKLRFPNTDLLVVFDVRGVKQVKGTWVSHQVGWAYLKLLNTSHCIAAGSFQLPLFFGAMSLGNMTPVGMPPSTAAKYAYDATNVQTQKKKKPLSKLAVGKTERECEKELNTTFAKDMDISHYTF
ncbi:hypothetical protein DYB35_003209 [Aphanomyces astaci]|uniref:Uncharacterized protein n=1 Tax=Aphanomyces astaci TaxID=112090 RepID=A0A3R6XZ26_APHAT|nr:hypothetical protein DYB35_003209 [Aphanomyces astaci]